MRHTLIIVCILLVIISSSVYAQQDWTSYHKNIVDDITAIAIEGDIIWLGTYNGLAKYNKTTGESIPYTTKDGLVNNDVNDIAVDNNGVKWIATNGGISSFDGVSFTSFNNRELGYTEILGATVGGDNTKWFISHDAVLKYDDVSWHVYTLENGLPVGSLTTIAVDTTDTVWIGTNKNGILSFDGNEWILHEEYKKNIVSIAVGEDNTKWFGGFKGSVISYDGIEWSQIQVVSSFYFLYSVAVSYDNVVWVGTNTGLFRIENDVKIGFTDDDDLENSICRLVKVGVDNELWIAGKKGLTRYNGKQFLINLGFTGPSENNVYSIAIDHDNIKWLGHGSNLISYVNELSWLAIGKRGYNNIGEDIAIDNDNVKWFTAGWDGALSYNGGLLTGHVIRAPSVHYSNYFYELLTKCIVVDHDNNIWIGSIGPDPQEFSGYTLKYNGISFSIYLGDIVLMNSTYLISLAIDSKNNLWLLNGYRLTFYDGENIYYIDGHLDKYHRMDKIYADNSDFIWGISNFGLSRFDPGKNNWIHYTTENSGLPSNNLYSVEADLNNTKWIGTDEGVTRFDGESWTTFNTENSGLCDNKVNAIAVEKNNTIWFGTDNGVSKYTGEIITTGVDEEDEKPEAIQIIKSYPNPFNPSTTIEFTLPESGFTTLSIYNISGQKVRELAGEHLTAGTHSLTWDGRDDGGNAVSSGIYITRLQAGKHVAAGRMLLMK